MAKKNKNLESEPQTIEELKAQNRSLKQTIGGLKTASEGFKKRINGLEEEKINLVGEIDVKDKIIKSLKNDWDVSMQMYDDITKEVTKFNDMPWYKKMLYHFD